MRHSDYFMLKQIEILNDHHFGVGIAPSLKGFHGRWFVCNIRQKGKPEIKWIGDGQTKAQALAAALVEYIISMSP